MSGLPLVDPGAGVARGAADEMFEKVKEIIASKKRFVLVTHINADGDGLGSQFALGRFLRRHGKDVRVINTDPLPRQFRFLVRGDEPEIYDPARHAGPLREADAIVILDNSSAHRLPQMRAPPGATPPAAPARGGGAARGGAGRARGGGEYSLRAHPGGGGGDGPRRGGADLCLD